MDIVFQLLTLDTRMRPCSQRTLITIPSIPGAARPSMRCSSCNPVSVLCCGELPFYRRRPWDLEWWNDCQLRSARGAYMQNGDPRGHSFYRQFFLSFALVWGIYITDWTSTMPRAQLNTDWKASSQDATWREFSCREQSLSATQWA
jgi:hypothetical protein